jgi:predicted ribosome quality control (RQC) complex YloA/Tae2 family protein
MVTFRTYKLRTGKEVSLGKNAENNDELVRRAVKEETILHTEQPGSPFLNLGEQHTKEELEEAATICAHHSQDWKKHKNDVNINIFKRKHMKKRLLDKKGTWNVQHQETITIKKENIKQWEEEYKKKKTLQTI